MSMEEYMFELVGEQFYQLVFKLAMEQQVDFEEDNRFTDRNESSNRDMTKQREKRFQKNRERLSKRFKLEIKSSKGQKKKLQEIFTYYKQAIRAEDLVKLMKGEAVNENLINLYFKILEKINFVLL